jgi:probable F420-dependent oxidoreductase
MAKIDLGPFGGVLSPGDDGFVEVAAELDRQGWSTVWISGGPMSALSQLADVVQATNTAKVASGIIPVVRFPSDDVAALYTSLEAEHPGRFVVGLGGAHGPDPIGTLNGYLDRLDGTVPQTRRVMAALGPKMFTLARERSSGAFPVLITPTYAARARDLIGDDTTLAVEQLVVLEADAAAARELARTPLGFLGTMPAYRANFARMGFGPDDIAGLSDRLVDELVVWGDLDAIAARVDELRAAGADHVAFSVLAGSPSASADAWSALASRFLTPAV